jgi:hypothetical protein
MGTERCDYCDRRLDRPPSGARLFEDKQIGCRFPERHAEADYAQRIIERIEWDLSDRRGLKQEWRQIDPDTQDEVRDEWARLVRKEIVIVT